MLEIQKEGCYTGFYKNIPQYGVFKYEEFLLANALPGPDSRIQCIIQNKYDVEDQDHFECIKENKYSQIPGFNYNYSTISQIPKPKEWVNNAIDICILKDMKLRRLIPKE